MNEALIAAFTELNDAAAAMPHCQLNAATAAADRLETARKAFYTLFIAEVQSAALAVRSAAAQDRPADGPGPA